MKETIGWARVKSPGAYGLRRGVWYPVVDDDASTGVLLDISLRTITIPRNILQIRRHQPERFSVVVRLPEDPNPVRGTPRDLGPTYAVCPSSGSRVRLSGHPDHLHCPSCHHLYAVAWDDEC